MHSLALVADSFHMVGKLLIRKVSELADTDHSSSTMCSRFASDSGPSELPVREKARTCIHMELDTHGYKLNK